MWRPCGDHVKTVQMTAAREVAAVNLSLGHRPDRVVPDCCPYAEFGIRTIMVTSPLCLGRGWAGVFRLAGTGGLAA